jgi:hypothetical protein
MPTSCTSVLTGQDGSVWFKPAGTSVCLRDHSDFVGGSTDVVIVPSTHDFRVADPVSFRVGTAGPVQATLDSAYTESTVYYIAAVGTELVGSVTVPVVAVSATIGGSIIPPNGNGGIGGAIDTPGAHIHLEYAEYFAVAQVANFSINLTREQLDTTALPAGIGPGQGKYAAFRTRQSGYASGTGQLMLRFTRDQSTLAARLISNSMLRVQDGAWVKLYIDTVSDGDPTNPQPDDMASSFFEAPISIEGVDAKVDPQNATEGTINFSISGTPTRVLTVSM